MKKITRIATVALAACMSAGTVGVLAGCGGGSSSFYAAEKLSTMENTAQDYNSNLFYVNSLEFEIADPSVIYITEGVGQGWFYAYGTSDEIGAHGIQTWRSKDLSHWEARGIALYPDYETTWAVDNYWAPEVIYDEETQLYYMFYNAYNQYDIVTSGSEPHGRLYISVAQSTSPEGPFVTPSKYNMDGDWISSEWPVIDLTDGNDRIPANDNRLYDTNALDASPFIDPETGKKYLYFGWYEERGDGTYLYGMEMKDWYTPDYSTLTRLTRPRYSSLDVLAPDRDSESHINEAPFMMYHEGKYYLTFSVNAYTSANYRVLQAVSDDPLGKYTKISEEDGGKVISTDFDWTHVASAGHHAFITVGDEVYIAYHTFLNRLSITDGRALAVDKIEWTTNSEGTAVMHTNGPSWSLQPLPEAISGYKNIAPSATLNAPDNGGDASLLTDGLIKYQYNDLVDEYQADAGEYTFTLTWDQPKTARAIMVYNSMDYFYTFDEVASIEIEYMRSNGSYTTATIENVEFDHDWFVDDEWEFITPGGAAIVEFGELPVRSVTITVSSKADAEAFALNEIVVLGKDEACAGVDELSDYSYQNATYGSSHIITQSNTFGTVMVDGEESDLATMYGYDLSHDDGTENAYIEQTGVRDQFAYFKDIYSTEFYAEAEFTVTVNDAFALDDFPKFGIAISCDDSVTSTLFYYVDAQNNYTLGQVGCAPRALGGDDWDWGREDTVSVPGISYTNGNTVKLAVIRQGADFWFLCNDTLAIHANSFALFGDLQRAGVGLLSFNTPMIVSNYYATADSSVVSQKLAQYVG